LLLLAAAPAPAELPVPALRGRVNDLAGVLDAAAAARLESRLADFERETTHQIAVLTVPSLEGEPIETFAFRVAEAWQLGQAGADNGILVVVAPQDRRARIEVGYGLEGVVPDAIAKRVLEDVMFGHFRSGDFAGGIEAGIDALMQAARGEVVTAQPPARRGSPHADPLAVVFFAALIGSVLAAPLRRARPLASVVGGGIGGGLAWLLLASLGWAAAAFALAFVFGLGGAAPLGGGRRRGGPVFFPGGGGWGGRGGFGGGGFGGGGGGFGGGGASGSW
jgi:uncharacterized protein